MSTPAPSAPTTATGPLPAGQFSYRDGVWYFVAAPVQKKA